MKVLFKKKLVGVYSILFSIIIGLCVWYAIYQHFFSNEVFVNFNWHVEINRPTKSEIILDAAGELAMDGQLYTVYTYDSKEKKN